MTDISFLENLSFYSSVLVIASLVFGAFIIISVWVYISNRKNMMINFSDVDNSLRTHNDLKNQNKVLQDQNEKLQKNIDNLTIEENNLKNSVDVCKTAQTELDKIIFTYDSKVKELREIEQLLAKNQAVKEFIEQHKKDELDEIDRMIEQKKQDLIKLETQMDTSRISDAMGKLCDLSADNRNLEQSIEDLKQTKTELTSEVKSLNDQVNKAQKQLTQHSTGAQINSSIDELVGEINHAFSKSTESLKSELQKINDLTAVREELQIQNHELQKKINRLNQQLNQPNSEQNEAAYKSLVDEPVYIREFKKSFTQEPTVTNHDELDTLSNFRCYLKSKDLSYSPRTIKAFHTSLKVQNVNPLSVLAGVSGTGKTQLAIQYANFFGLYKEHVAVQPRWDSKDDLLGFYNFLEQRFQPTKLATSLYWFDQNLRNNPIQPHPMMLVILDEMNLARVEYYFSEFLSKLELRNSSRKVNSCANEESAIILGAAGSNKRINVDFRNVLFVGTMNEDESTFSLSDKVLDRANVLHFGPPSQFGQDTKEMYDIKPIQLNTMIFANWCNKNELPDDYKNELNTILNALNNKLELVGKGFGHRVNKSINEYVRLYPGTLTQQRFNTALSDQLEMKIIPKLSGLEKNDQADECLSTVQRIISNLGDTSLINSFNNALDNFERDSMFIWHGVKRDSADTDD